MKSNVQYVFDRITRSGTGAEEWGKLDKSALIDLAIAIAAADRGVALSADKALLIAETVLAARGGGEADLRQLRAALHLDRPSFAR